MEFEILKFGFLKICGKSRIRTYEGWANRFTVCPVWPLRYLPINFSIFIKNLSRISDSNWGPRDYKSRALANWANSAYYFVSLFLERCCLNQRVQRKVFLCELPNFFSSFFSFFFRTLFLSKKVGKLPVSHRSTAYPCCLPTLGGFSRSWSHRTYPAQK